jgi:acetyl esterase/lipase
VHGGCWLEAYDISHTYALATALAHEGYPVWNLEYRRAGATGSSWPASYTDIRAGLQKVTALARFGINTDKLVIVGHSAGGHLAMLAAADWPNLFPDQQPRASAIGLAAITDIEGYARGENSCQRATALFMGGMPATRQDAYAAATPRASDITIPVTLLHGDQDPIVPMNQFEQFEGPMIRKSVERGAAHFDWIHPGTPAFRTLLEHLSTPQREET